MEEGSQEKLDREESIEEETPEVEGHRKRFGDEEGVDRKKRGPGEDDQENLDMNRKK